MTSFDKVIGYEKIKGDLLQVADMFRNEDIYKRMGATMPNGILLYGDPGLGKTTLAKALIEACGVKAFTVKNNFGNLDCLVNKINEAFALALNEGRAIVFLDDLDKFSESKSDDSDDAAFVCVQSCIDDAKGSGVLALATANNERKLPKSLLRSGRFDRKILVDSPTGADASEIIKYYLKGKNVDKALDFDDVCKMISYESCAKLESVINESAISAASQRKETIGIDDIVKAYYGDVGKNGYGNELASCDDELYGVCLHEAGHAAIGECLKENSVGFISAFVSSNGDRDGFTKFCHTFKRRGEDILVGLGGKASSELFYKGLCASGSQGDLSKVMSLIEDGIANDGTAGAGVLNVTDKYSMSEALRAKIEVTSQAELERYYFLAKDILIKNRDFVFSLADELMAKGYLLHSDIKRIRRLSKVVPFTLN